MPNFQNFGVQTWRRPDIFRQKVIYLNSRQSEAQGWHGSHSFKLNLSSSERRHEKSSQILHSDFINSALLSFLCKQCSKWWPSCRSCASLCSSNKRLSFIMYINLTYLGNHGLGVFGFITIDIEIHWNRYEPYIHKTKCPLTLLTNQQTIQSTTEALIFLYEGTIPLKSSLKCLVFIKVHS